MVVVIDEQEITPDVAFPNRYKPTIDNELRFDETDYYFLENGREILVIIEPERYDVSEVSYLGLEVLFMFRFVYVEAVLNNPYLPHLEFRYLVKKYIDDFSDNPVVRDLTPKDIDSIYDALKVGSISEIFYDLSLFFRQLLLKIQGFFRMSYHDIRIWFRDLKENIQKLLDWRKEYCIDFTIFGINFKIDIFTITGIYIAWMMGIAIVAFIGYFGYIYLESFVIERGVVEARATAPIGKQIKKAEKSVKKKLKKVI